MRGTSTTHDFAECKTPDGRVLATVEIFARGGAEGIAADEHPLVRFPADEAARNGEEPLQLRERGRYEYILSPKQGEITGIMLLAGRGIQPSLAQPDRGDRGLIEPQDYCGLLPLVVVRRGDNSQEPLAIATVEVRSLKLGYREHYRGMLSFIAEKCAGLVLDSRAPTRLRLNTLWQRDSRILEQQLEFLRHTLESPSFAAAINEVLRNPHRRLEDERELRSIAKSFRPNRSLARQISTATRRVDVPMSHPIRAKIPSLPALVSARRRIDFLDTAENRFAKMVLLQFRDFLTDVTVGLSQRGDTNRPDNARLLRESTRLRGMLEGQLARGFFPDVSSIGILALGSPVLQRRPGYREILRYWLQFHAGAQLVWDGGPDVFRAGSRDVATLYEYWLFFQLESLFRRKFACEEPLHSLIVDTATVPPQLTLKRGVGLTTPTRGAWAESVGRQLRAEFRFNRKFTPRASRGAPGTWTRGAQPDYTISIWPAEFSQDEAEQNELMAHVHFDAKYRVEGVAELLGDESDDAEFAQTEDKEQARTAAKYTDLIKMHAYRDAIRRTAGAYVLYPGNPGDGRTYRGFHEVLPGLGAFAVRPDAEGKGKGLEDLSTFLDGVIEHLSNRTTARERATYHLANAYEVKEAPVAYEGVRLDEGDSFLGHTFRAVPPAEHMVLVAWYRDEAQVRLARRPDGIVFVRLGRRRGGLHVHPNLSRARHILLRSSNEVAEGLVRLREPGFRVYSRADLRKLLIELRAREVLSAWDDRQAKDEEAFLYAVFKTREDPDWSERWWDASKVLEEIGNFESDARNKPITNVGRGSPQPRVLPLRSVLKALIN